MARGLFLWLFVMKMMIQRDNDVRPRRLFVGKRCKRRVKKSTRSSEMVLLISPCPISVVEFLRRGRVDHSTRGGKVVVVTDLSKRKVENHPNEYC